MAKPIVHIYQPVDQTGKSHERLEAAGAKLIMPSGTWDLMANSRVSEEAVLDPGTSVAAGVANRSISNHSSDHGRSPRSEVSRQIHGGL